MDADRLTGARTREERPHNLTRHADGAPGGGTPATTTAIPVVAVQTGKDRAGHVRGGEWSQDDEMKLRKMGQEAARYGHVLIIMRHAKAEGAGEMGDKARALSEKGRRQARVSAKGIAAMGLTPDEVISSAADRARQTTERALTVFGDKPQVRYSMDLYDGGMQAFIDAMEHVKDKRRVTMIVGHEPTVSQACQWFASAESDPDALSTLLLGFSPASFAILASDKPVSQWQAHDARVIAVVRPRDL